MGETSLGNWQTIASLLQSYLDQWTALLSKAPLEIVLTAGLLPVALGAFSKRLIVLLGCMLLTAMAVCAILAPSNIGVTLATGVYLGGLIVALWGVVARRNAGAVQAELASLRGDVNRLLDAEERHYLAKLRER
jgi:hypothetical protein